MRLSIVAVAAASLLPLAQSASVSETVHQYWDQTELRRWLQDYGVIAPDRTSAADLRRLVAKEWDGRVASSLPSSWDDLPDLPDLASLPGWSEIASSISSSVSSALPGKSDPSLSQRLGQIWNSGLRALGSVGGQWQEARTWVFDSWSDSQLRRFVRAYGPSDAPVPSSRQELLAAARAQYDTAAGKLSTSKDRYYPGDWIYDTWSDSELRALLAKAGTAAWTAGSQAGDAAGNAAGNAAAKATDSADAISKLSRKDLLARVRRTWLVSRIIANSPDLSAARAGSVVGAATSSVSSALSAASAGAANAYDSVSAKVAATAADIRGWSEAELRGWARDNGVAVPRGANYQELAALVKQQMDRKVADATRTAGGVYGAATSSVTGANAYTRATDALWELPAYIKDALGISTAGPRGEL